MSAESSRIMKNLSKCCWVLQNLTESFRILQDLAESCRILQNLSQLGQFASQMQVVISFVIKCNFCLSCQFFLSSWGWKRSLFSLVQLKTIKSHHSASTMSIYHSHFLWLIHYSFWSVDQYWNCKVIAMWRWHHEFWMVAFLNPGNRIGVRPQGFQGHIGKFPQLNCPFNLRIIRCK